MGAAPSSRLDGILPLGWLPVSHAEAILENTKIQLYAFCDNDQERLQQLGAYYNVKYLYNDFQDLIQETQPDFLCIATRTQGRTDIIKYACQNNVKIIYLEKPISRSIADCRSTLEICKKYDVLLGYGVNRRYHFAYRKAKEIIKSGIVGQLREINIEHGRSSLLWSHPHSADLILFFAEDTQIEYIQGTCSYTDDYIPENIMFIDNDPIIEHAYLKFKNGITANINQVGGLNVRLGCTEGIVTVYGDGTHIEIRKGDGYFTETQLINPEPRQSATVTAFRELVDALKTDSPIPIKQEEILTNMIILNGIVYSSINGGQRIAPSEIPEEMIVTGKSGVFYA